MPGLAAALVAWPVRSPFEENRAMTVIRPCRWLPWLLCVLACPRLQAQDIVPPPQRESVRPGINDEFLDPELKVGEWERKFEVESREIYASREGILRAVGLKRGERVADVGAGTGLFALRFAQEVGDEGWVYATDISPRFVEHVAVQAGRHGIANVSPVLCPQDSTGLPPASVDVAFLCDVYHHFEYPPPTLASLRKAVRPGGRLVVVDFERIEGKSRPWILGHLRAGKEVFRREIEDAGFRFVEEKKVAGLRENYFLVFERPGRPDGKTE